MIDAHLHVYSPDVGADPAAWAVARGETHWAKLCTRVRRDGRPVQAFPSVGELLGAMDAAGVERGVLLGWYWEHPATCREQNRFLAACCRAHPTRLVACATLHPAAGRAETLAEVAWARDEGFVGFGELSPHSAGYACNDPVFSEVLARAGEWGMPVNLHVTDPASRRYPGWVETPAEDFIRLAEEFPQTDFVLAHFGGRLALDHPRLRARPNVSFDTAAAPVLYDADQWRSLIRDLGEDRMLFGSDFPLDLYPRAAGLPPLATFAEEMRRAGVSEAVLRRNAARVFGRAPAAWRDKTAG